MAEIHFLDNQLTALSKKQIKIRLSENDVANNNKNDSNDNVGRDDDNNGDE